MALSAGWRDAFHRSVQVLSRATGGWPLSVRYRGAILAVEADDGRFEATVERVVPGLPRLMQDRASQRWRFYVARLGLRSVSPRRCFSRLLLGILLALLLITPHALRLNPTDAAASSYLFDLPGWEMTHFMGKWLFRVRELLPGGSLSDEKKKTLVGDYFQLADEERRLQGELEQAVAEPDRQASTVKDIEDRLKALRDHRKSMIPRVEEVLESEISGALNSVGLASRIGVLFPPVDFSFDRTPKVLVVSPRDRIEVLRAVLLRPEMSVNAMEALEKHFLDSRNLSALVDNTGGVATYPAVIPSTTTLLGALVLASHEWMHHYFFFHPLGQNYAANPDMTTLNETAADLASAEVAFEAYYRFTGERLPLPGAMPPGEPPAFDFNKEMRQTRLKVEEMLAGGRIEEAEQYMEQRRQFFVEHGYLIRKLNQAYFAFHGTYADSPASISPIYGQLQELRRLSPSVGSFIKLVASVSSYQEFRALLEKRRQAASAAGENVDGGVAAGVGG